MQRGHCHIVAAAYYGVAEQIVARDITGIVYLKNMGDLLSIKAVAQKRNSEIEFLINSVTNILKFLVSELELDSYGFEISDILKTIAHQIF